jgi:biotin carboxyl carrier protein
MPENKPVVYKVKVNDFEFAFTKEDIDAIDLVQKSADTFHLIKDNRSVKGVLTNADRFAKQQTIEVNGQNFDVQIKDELDMRMEEMGFNIKAGKQVKEIKAPMPGLVLEVAVSEGQQVNEGERVLILVAMKMENSIMAHADAVIKRIAVKPGQAVEKGQLLVELE